MDNSTPDDQQDRRRLFSDVWGPQTTDQDLPARSRKDVDMPPLVERAPSGDARLDTLEASLRDIRNDLEGLRASHADLRDIIERIARRLQLAGYSETT
ncbi:MAG: hypothetical protein ACRDH9_03405 [Actinomycetota bacterium]